MPTDDESFCCTESDIINKIRKSEVCVKYHVSFEAVVWNIIDTLNTTRHFMLSANVAPGHMIQDLEVVEAT